MHKADAGDMLGAMTNAQRAQFVNDSLGGATGGAICGLNPYPGLGPLGLGPQVHCAAG